MQGHAALRGQQAVRTGARIVARRSAGNSLAEMMVGLAVGLIVMAVVLKVGVLFDARRKSVSGMAAAHIDGTLAML